MSNVSSTIQTTFVLRTGFSRDIVAQQKHLLCDKGARLKHACRNKPGLNFADNGTEGEKYEFKSSDCVRQSEWSDTKNLSIFRTAT